MNRGYHYRTPVFLQMESAECGVVSLAMILAYYGINVNLEKLREQCNVGRNGTKASRLLEIARSYNVDASGYKATIEDLKNLTGPTILFWEGVHFLVLTGINKAGNKFYLNDPASGSICVSKQEMERSFSGIVLVFSTKNKRRFNLFRRNGNLQNNYLKNNLSKHDNVLIAWNIFLLVCTAILFPLLVIVWSNYMVDRLRDWVLGTEYFFLIAVVLDLLLFGIFIKLNLKVIEKTALNESVVSFRRLLNLPYNFFKNRYSGTIQRNISSAPKLAKYSLDVFVRNIFSCMAFIIVVIVMCAIKPLLALLSLSFLFITAIVIWFILQRRQVDKYSLNARKNYIRNSISLGLSSFEDMKVLGRDDVLFDSWTASISKYVHYSESLNWHSIVMDIVPNVITILGYITIFSVGVSMIMKSSLSIGELAAIMLINWSVLHHAMNLIKNHDVNIDKKILGINDITDHKVDSCLLREHVPNPTNNICNDSEIPLLEMRNLSFSYDSDLGEVVKDFSLALKPGKVVAIVGKSGSGKSTILKMLAGLLKAEHGEILLNGYDITKIAPKDYYKYVGYVSQTSLLFTGTIEENVSMFSPLVNVFEFRNALKDTLLESELVGMGLGSSSKLSDNGKILSGGQKQRLALARVLYRCPKIIILDEATSALDSLLEKKILARIKRRGVSILMTAHRIDTIKDADEILVLDQGHICEKGSYKELLQKNGLFSKLAKPGEKN